MTFSVIGTGNIAWYFSRKIAAAGHQCKGVFGRNTAAVKELADTLLAPMAGPITEVHDDIADVCFLAVNDTALQEIAGILSFQTTVPVHMAGALPLGVLQPAAKDYGLLWPVYSINKQQLPRDRNIPCAWEASSERAKKYLLEMGHAITDELFEASESQRQWLHLCAVLSNNFINHLLAVNEKICAEQNLAVSVLQPLITQTFERAKNNSPFNMQTGPAMRNDTATIEHHLEMLDDKEDVAELYRAITASIKEMHHIG